VNLIASAPTWLAALLFLLLLTAAVEDGWRARISNFTCAMIVVGAFVAVALDGPIVGLWQNLLLFGAVLVVGTFLFARGAMGGGDIKLLAASALWFDLDSGWKMLVAIALAGGIEALVLVAVRRALPSAGRSRRIALLRRGEGIPYGIAIAAGVSLMGWWLRT
jgi:prepilin peptidase CpaA